ncbi:MAG: hypothetical protein ACRDYF_14015 [Acidimicrobiia bacterium]
MSDGRRRVPTEAEWQRLDSAFGVFFLVTLAVAAIFMSAAPFPPLVGAIVMAPLVVPTAWIWIMVIRRRDVDRLLQLNAFAARRRRRRRPGRQ